MPRLSRIGVLIPSLALGGCLFGGNEPWQPTDRLSPELVESLEGPATTIAAGLRHSCAQTSSDQVSCWGGFLSPPNNLDYVTDPRVVGVGGPVVSIGAGEDRTCTLDSTGTVECWGWGTAGALGVESEAFSDEPVVVESLAGEVSQLVVGRGHACARLKDARVACWGDNLDGQIGLDASISGTDETGPHVVPETADRVAVGAAHTCVSLGAVVRCWGDNQAGQVAPDRSRETHVSGQTTLSSSVVGLALGADYTCALLESDLVCWGTGLHQGSAHAWAVELPGATSVQIVGGAGHACVLDEFGEAWCWGDDSYGQVGDGGDALDLLVSPVGVAGGPFVELAAGHAHTCGLTDAGAVHCWGSNAWLQVAPT